MFTVILRSVCVGIAFVVGAIPVGIFVVFLRASYSFPRPESGQVEVGWDLVTLYHNISIPMTLVILPLVIFSVGFLVGFRYFSRSLAVR